MVHGADIEAKGGLGMTPLHWACVMGHLAVVIELLSPDDLNGATTILGKRKRSRRADIDAKNRDCNTPLHVATMKDI
jgi:ankyrin repeat protein